MKKLVLIFCVLMLSTACFAIDCPLPDPTPQPNITHVCIPEFSYLCVGSSRFLKVVSHVMDSAEEVVTESIDYIPLSEWSDYLTTVIPTGWTYLKAQKYFVRNVLVDRGTIPSSVAVDDIDFTCNNCE